MFGSNFINRQRQRLQSRRTSKLEILKYGGEQALSHSPHDILRIDFAIKRIESGQYGLCTKCGSVIDPKRLEIIPEANTCTSCAERTEG